MRLPFVFLCLASLASTSVNAQSITKSPSSASIVFKEGKDFIHYPAVASDGVFHSATAAYTVKLTKKTDGVDAQLSSRSGKKAPQFKVNNVAQADAALHAYITSANYVVVREGEVVFSIFSPAGKLLNSVNTFEGLSGKVGPALFLETGHVSALVANPEIKTNAGTSARLTYISLADGSHREAQFLMGYTIASLQSNPAGNRFWLVANKVGKNEGLVLLLDAFGNKLGEFTSDFTLTGANLDEKGDVLTVFSESRVSVHNLTTGSRLGGTAQRGEQIAYANYNAQDDQILMMLFTGKSGNTYSGVSFKAISIGLRKIASDSGTPATVKHIPNLPLYLVRIGKNSYQLTGVDTPLLVKTSF